MLALGILGSIVVAIILLTLIHVAVPAAIDWLGIWLREEKSLYNGYGRKE